ncbi:helix-turn-helix domain-containing protein [Streptomyces chrestomyceticus]|uniref:helix-turn-helix domain-containing protein n=1 Tax=Streptomyces chrestomyceticus TaxID=68185 RepID=UPI0033DFE820
MTFEPGELRQSKADLQEALRALRRRAGRTQAWLAQRCNMSQTKLSNIETDRVTPSLVDVELILRALDTPANLAAEVSGLARLAHTEWQSKRTSWRRGLEKRQCELAALEAEAVTLRYFLPAMVTGLLATPEYVRASLGHSPMNTFTVYDHRLATVETFTGRIVFQDARDVAEHLEVFDRYQRHASFGEEARGLLSSWAGQYRS